MCYFKLPFSEVFVAIQSVFCSSRWQQLFCVVSCVNTGPYQVQDRFLMAGTGQGEVLGYLLQFLFSSKQ